jgi:hypothetical protein
MTEPTRCLLRLHETHAIQLIPELEHDENYKQFIRTVKGSRKTHGAIQTHKGMVVQIMQNPDPSFPAHPTVDRMGAVASFILPDQYHIPLKGISVPIQIAVTPNLGTIADFDAYSNSFTNEKILLESFLKVRLDFCFRQYLEDIGEDLHDIENHLSWQQSCRRARRVEITISQSMGDKIGIILKNLQDDSPPALKKISLQIWRKFGGDIVQASLVRYFVSSLLNKLYPIIGSTSKTDFQEKWNRRRLLLDNLYKKFSENGTSYDDFIANTHIRILEDALSSFEGKDDTEQISFHDSIPDWIVQIVNFTKFINQLRKENISSRNPRIFLSAPHDNTSAHIMLTNSKQYLESKSPKIQVFTVNTSVGGTNYKKLIKHLIWLSNGVMGIIPKDWSKTDGSTGDLEWVAKELEHGQFLRKWAVPYAEKNTPLLNIQNEFKKELPFLSPCNGRADADLRKQKLRALVNELVFCRYDHKATPVIDANLREDLDNLANVLLERHTKELLRGYLYFFDHNHVQTLLQTLEFTQHRGYPPREIYVYLSGVFEQTAEQSEKRFKNMWDTVSRRKLQFDGKEIPLLKVNHGGRSTTYQNNLAWILREIAPHHNDQAIRDWGKNLLNEWLSLLRTE